MAQLPAGRKSKRYDFLGGGLVTRPDDRYTNLLNDKGHFYSPDETNLQFTKIASMQKRFGYDQNGIDIQGASTSILQSALTADVAPYISVAVDGSYCEFYAKITASATNTIEAVTMRVSASGSDPSLLSTLQCFILNDNAGAPGTVRATASNSYVDAYEIEATQQAPVFFYFPAPVAVTNATAYWICVKMLARTGAAAATSKLLMFGNDSSVGVFKYGTTGSLTTSTTFTPYQIIYTGSRPVLGIYDYRPQAAGVITQFPMLACNGNLYYYNAGYTSIASGLASSVNSLYDFETLKNLLFSCDLATSANQCWDGSAAATMTAGYRGTFATAQTASAGGPWSNGTGIVKVMLVTALRSGGYRASTVASVTLASATNKIDLSAITVDAIATQFSFDVASTATTAYCTLPNGTAFYKIPAAYLSTAGNPIANTQTANSILPMTDAQLIAGGTIELGLGYAQGYFTGQVATPKAKYFQVFQNMLASAGDPNNPSRVWFTEQYAPNVWGDGSSGTGIQGDFLDVAVDDGETITGLAVSDGALMIGKQSSIYRVDFTGNAVNTWVVNRVHGQIGVLSHWSMQIIPEGLYFLSARGPAICYGTYSDVLPQTRFIQNLFDNTSTTSFNLNSMIYAVACNDTSRNQVMMTVSSTGTTVRDRILAYDYEQKMFGLYDGYQANYIAILGDSNGLPVLWNGNYSGQAFKRSSDYKDNGVEIISRFSTPNIDFGDPSSFAQLDFLHVSGKALTSLAKLYVDVFAENAALPYRTIVLDMTKADFATGLAVRLGFVGKSVKLRFRSVNYRGTNNLEIHWMRLEWSESGGTRLG